MLLSARFVRFCGRQTSCFIGLPSASRPRLVLAAGKVLPQLLRCPRLALGLALLGPVSGAILLFSRMKRRILHRIVVVIVHGRTHSGILPFSIVPGRF